MRILITGASGFVGKNLIPKMVNSNLKNNKIALLSRDNQKTIEIFEGFNEIEYIDLTENDYKTKIKIFNPEIVLHMASYLTSKDDEESIKRILSANIDFGTNLLDALNETDIKYFINIGTFAEYFYNDGNLQSAYLYSATKTAFRSILEYYSKKICFKIINVVPYTIYGGKDSQKKVIDFVISSLAQDHKVAMSGGEQRLDFIHMDDVIKFFIVLIERIETIKEKKIEFHLGTGIGTSIYEMAKIVEKVFNEKANIEWGALPYRKMDIMQAIAHTSKNNELLAWKSKISLVDGIRRMKKGKNNE